MRQENFFYAEGGEGAGASKGAAAGPREVPGGGERIVVEARPARRRDERVHVRQVPA